MTSTSLYSTSSGSSRSLTNFDNFDPLTTYARTMHEHTLRQMKAATSTRRRTTAQKGTDSIPTLSAESSTSSQESVDSRAS